MGVPKFFRYTSERYPCLNELVKQYQIPDFDNMYLDMNGIIHNCSHPDDSNAHFRITEEKIFQDIFHYLSILFQIIKPRKLFFMAIDGVAPRAKMNQQRGRRFRSAKEAEKIEEDAKAKGEVLPAEKRFDSNCITPGTVFMARLHEQLRYFVKQKVSTDPLWSKVKVVLSGHETPGEGEHKIMDYIRWARSQPDYDPNTKHCLYGLDADLVMLGMCTHEPHFALLREEVKFGKTTQRTTSPEETNFYLLHLSLLREYLEQEFIEIKDKLPFPYDIEKVVDDWVLMGFLVGNDFIPNLPNMHINNDALPLLYKTYTTVLPTLDGYINEAGDLNLARFEVFMQELAKIDKEKFHENYADLKFFEAKTGRRPNAQERKEYKPNNDDTFNVNIDDIKANKPDDELQALIDATHDMFLDDLANDEDGYEDTSDDEANFEMEFVLHKKDYYMNKLDYTNVTNEVLADQAECYVRAIQWNLFYYYKGCPSWCWYYPHHYAPYISDIKGFKDLKIEFELGEPFKPFEQLLAVLPAASKQLLPAPFHELMTDEDSPIVHYYPVHFDTDLNGKRNDWEAVVLIPFIDETNLLSAMTPCYKRLTDEELKRNTHGPILVYNWTPHSLGPHHAPEYFPVIPECYAIEKAVWRSELDVPREMLKRGMLPNAKRDMLFPGFPTLRHLKYTGTLKKMKVKVFDQPSRNISMFIELVNDVPLPEKLEDVAAELLGKVIWVGWPHLTKAKVISVSNEDMRYHHVDNQNNNVNGPKWTTETNKGNLHRQWISERSTIIEHNLNRLGIELGDVKIIVHAVNHKGYKYVIQDNVTMVQEPEWCSVPCGYAYQSIVRDVSACIIQEDTKFSTPQEAFAPGATAILLTQGQYYGTVCKVVDSESIRSGRIKVQMREETEPNTKMQAEAQPYHSTNYAGSACGISAQFLSRITGTILVVLGERHDMPTDNCNKINLGLNLKFNKKNLEVAGYTRRCKTSNQWLYSSRCIELVKSYMRQYPDLFDQLAHSINNDIYFESDIWPKEIGLKKPQDVQSWLKSQSHVKALRRECGSEALEQEEIRSLWEHLRPQLETRQQEKKLTLHVKWNLLYKPELHEGNVQPDPKADYKMFDRVVCSSRTMTVPFGAKGTVIAVLQPADSNTVRLSDKLNCEPSYHVMFDKPFPGGMTEELFDEPRFYRMQPTSLINISFGRKIRQVEPQDVRRNKSVPKTTPTPNLLWRSDGLNSAFASYSPPADIKHFDNKISNTNVNGAAKPEDQTNLLKSLLKISEADDDSKKNTDPGQNRRYPKESYNQVPPPTNRRNPQQNWRTDRDPNKVTGAPPPQPFEWTNSGYKPPLLPLPTYKPAGQHPFPSYQIKPSHSGQGFHGNQPHQGQGFHGNQMKQDSGYGNTRQPSFPKHLPNVSASLLTPSWDKGENLSSASTVSKPIVQDSSLGSASNSAPKDRVPNPFVPLQVQTSQRRVQNTGASISRKNEGTVEPPNPVEVVPQTTQQFNNPPLENNSARKRRKCKPRIAANLPFQLE